MATHCAVSRLKPLPAILPKEPGAMSIKRMEEMRCPACGREQRMLVWSSVNAKDPEAALMVREQRVNLFQCEVCGAEAFVDESVLYHDMEKRYCIQYVSKAAMGSEAYYATLTKRGTVILDAVSQRILDKNGETYFNHPHFVFSIREMAAYIIFRELCATLGQEVDT